MAAAGGPGISSGSKKRLRQGLNRPLKGHRATRLPRKRGKMVLAGLANVTRAAVLLSAGKTCPRDPGRLRGTRVLREAGSQPWASTAGSGWPCLDKCPCASPASPCVFGTPAASVATCLRNSAGHQLDRWPAAGAGQASGCGPQRVLVRLRGAGRMRAPFLLPRQLLTEVRALGRPWVLVPCPGCPRGTHRSWGRLGPPGQAGSLHRGRQRAARALALALSGHRGSAHPREGAVTCSGAI